jgi:hypothetical protein
VTGDYDSVPDIAVLSRAIVQGMDDLVGRAADASE